MAADTSVIGKKTGSARLAVERGPVSNFAKSLKDESPIYHNVRAAVDAGFESIPAPPTFGFAMGQMIEQAVTSTKSLDQKVLAKYLRENTHKTIVGPITFAADGEWKETATLQAQFRGVVDKNIEQFRKPGKQVILYPEKLKSGDLITPFEAARK